MDRDDLCEFIFRQAKRLFAKDVFARGERFYHLRRMKMVTSCNYDGIHYRVMQDFFFVCRAISKAKLVGGMTGMRAAGGAHPDQIGLRSSLYGGKQGAHGKVACAQKSDSD